MPLLFSYGTLQQADVQRATFGRLLAGTADALLGFEQALIAIEDAAVVATSGKRHHPIVRPTPDAGARVPGTVFEVSDAELAQADRYEVAAYRRVAAPLASGRTAWVYIDVRHAAANPVPMPSPAPADGDDLPPLPDIARGHYRHYKGGEYEVLDVVRHSETLEPLVLYRPLYKATGLWVRPFAMFLEQVEVAGETRPRFARVLGPQ